VSTFQADNVTISVSDDVADLMTRIAAQAGQISLTTVQEMVDEVYADADRRWPILTGVSKAGLQKYARVQDGMVLVGIRNPVRYVRYIRSRKEGREKLAQARKRSGKFKRTAPTWSTLVSAPLKKVVKRDIRKIAKAFVKAAGS